MAVFTQQQNEFIVRQMAMMYFAELIARGIMLRWPAVRCTADDVRRLDPREFIVAPELDSLFKKEHAAFLKDASPDAPITDKRIRNIEWQRLYEHFRDRNQLLDAERILTKVALEMSGDTDGLGKAVAPLQIDRITRTIIDPVKA